MESSYLISLPCLTRLIRFVEIRECANRHRAKIGKKRRETALDGIARLVDYLNLCAITPKSWRIASNNSQRIHSFGIYAIRGILCPLSGAFAKRCPLFDIGRFHKRIDGELPAGQIYLYQYMRTLLSPNGTIELQRTDPDNYTRHVKNVSSRNARREGALISCFFFFLPSPLLKGKQGKLDRPERPDSRF